MFEGIRQTVIPGPHPYDGSAMVGARGGAMGGAMGGAGVPPPYDGSAMGGARGGANIGSKTANVVNRGGSIATGAIHNVSMYTSLPTSDPGTNNDYEPVYTAGGRQAFKPSFYSSSWGREYIKTKVEREFDRIEHQTNTGYGDVGMVTSTDGTTQYIRFEDTADSGAGAGAYAYASIFISPYYDKNGNAITSFSSWTKADAVGACLFIYNIIQFIYQLMMYTSIVRTCRDVGTTIELNTTLVRWLC